MSKHERVCVRESETICAGDMPEEKAGTLPYWKGKASMSHHLHIHVHVYMCERLQEGGCVGAAE